jgi:sigma54-dependent transcription regulator
MAEARLFEFSQTRQALDGSFLELRCARRVGPRLRACMSLSR